MLCQFEKRGGIDLINGQAEEENGYCLVAVSAWTVPEVNDDEVFDKPYTLQICGLLLLAYQP